MLTLRALPGLYAAAKLTDDTGVDWNRPFLFFARTADEISLICEAERVPRHAAAVEGGYRALQVDGPLDFSLVGIMADISGALAARGISLLAVSTFDTDYVFVKEARMGEAVEALREMGWRVETQETA